MAELYNSEAKFKIGEMEDAEEALNEILKLLHSDHISAMHSTALPVERSEALNCSPPCISHAAFGLQACDIKICTKCASPSEPYPSEAMIYRAYAEELIISGDGNFNKNLRKSYQAVEYSCFDEKCDGKAIIQRWCLKSPEIFAIGVTWKDNPSKELIYRFLESISDFIDLNVVFNHQSNDFSRKVVLKDTLLNFKGFIAYYGKHYVAFFYSDKLRTWLLFDDQKVERVGSWRHAKLRCHRSRYQPVVIFYEKDSNIQASPELAKSLVPDIVVTVKAESQKVADDSKTSISNALDWLCDGCKNKWIECGSQCCPVCEIPQIQLGILT